MSQKIECLRQLRWRRSVKKYKNKKYEKKCQKELWKIKTIKGIWKKGEPKHTQEWSMRVCSEFLHLTSDTKKKEGKTKLMISIPWEFVIFY